MKGRITFIQKTNVRTTIFFQEGAENQGNNPPPASDNECPEYEQSTRNYGQCPGFKYQKLDDTIGKPDEHIVVK